MMLHYTVLSSRNGVTMGILPVQQLKLMLAALTLGTFVKAAALVSTCMQ